jgi:hypothetical protein
MPTIDEILAVAEDPAYHRVTTARIAAVRQELRDEHAQLDALLHTLTSDTIDEHPDRLNTVRRLAEIEDEFEQRMLEFRFRSIGHQAWADLISKHPPTRKQLADNRQLDHNPETFPYVAMAASCVDPVMTVEDVRRLDASPLFDVAAWLELWGACLNANVQQAAPKSMAAGLIRRLNGDSEITAVNGASLAASSSDES